MIVEALEFLGLLFCLKFVGVVYVMGVDAQNIGSNGLLWIPNKRREKNIGPKKAIVCA